MQKKKSAKSFMAGLASVLVCMLLPLFPLKTEAACSHSSWSEWYTYEMPECTEPGKERRYCLECYEDEYRDIPAIGGHSWGEWAEIVPAGCLEDGEKYRICSKCYKSEYAVIPARGYHRWGDWEVTEEPTCFYTGEKSRMCLDCEAVEEEELPTNNEHDWDDWYTVKSATALRQGKLARMCLECDKEETKTVPKLKAKAKLKKKITITDKKSHSMGKYLTKTRGDKASKWTSSNKKVATVNGKGRLTARKNGRTTIRVKMKSGASASCTVTVRLKKKTSKSKSSGKGGSGTSGGAYYTPYGEKYHSTKNCPTLSRSRVIYSTTIPQAQNMGLGACKVCH